MNLVIVQGVQSGHVVSVIDGMILGRDSANQMVITDPRISRAHARIEKQEEGFFIRDLESSNGTFVNDQLVTLSPIKEGDVIRLGNTVLKVVSLGEGPVIEEDKVHIVPSEVSLPEIKQTVDGRKSTIFDVDKQALKGDQFVKRAKNLSVLYKTGSMFSGLLEEEQIISKIVDLIIDVIKADRYVVMFRDEKTQELVPKVIRRGNERTGPLPIAISQSIIETVMKEHLGVICAHTVHDERFRGAESIYIYGIKSAMCVPISVQDKILGLIYCDSLVRAGQFEDEDLKMLTAIAAQIGIAVENARLYRELRSQEKIKHELQIAREIQQILLPHTFPKLDGVNFCFQSIAAEEVGGDYYDWFWVDSEKLALVVADVSGKGVPGAIVMAMFRSTLKSKALGAVSSSGLLREVNNLLMPDMKQDMFISATLAILDIKNRKLTFSRAGHCPLMIYRTSTHQLEELAPKGIALGFSPWIDTSMIEEQTVSLSKGDIAIFYTDGVIEAKNPEGEYLGKDRFIELLKTAFENSVYEKTPILLQKILEGIHDFSKGEPQSDDITLGFFKVE